MRHIERVLIIANLAKNDTHLVLEEITAYLRQRSIAATVFAFRGRPEAPEIGFHDAAISLGGDGTVLFAARLLYEQAIPILPVNLGNFGFITEVPRSEWRETFEKYLAGEVDEGERILIQAEILRGGNEAGRLTALNDIVISSSRISKLISLSVDLSGSPIGRYRADGIIVATPTGSTAYSVAAGGPILHPEMEALILNPICPFTLAHRSLVLPKQEIITVTVDTAQRTDLILTNDGQAVMPLREGDIIRLRVAGKRARIIRTDKRTFYTVLKEKLNWSGGSHA